MADMEKNESGVFIDKEKAQMGNWVTIHEYGAGVLVGVGDNYDIIRKEEAISAARAILSHFNAEMDE